jgi:hypothetical protein
MATRCPKILEMLSETGASLGQMESPFEFIYRNSPTAQFISPTEFLVSKSDAWFRVSKRLTAKEKRLAKRSIELIPPREFGFFRFTFSDGSLVETDLVVEGNEWGMHLHPLHLAKSNLRIQRKRQAGLDLVELELIHPHVLEPSLLRSADGLTYPLVAFPEGADQLAVVHFEQWLKGFAQHSIGEESFWLDIDDPIVVRSVPVEMHKAFQTIKSWGAFAAQVRVTAIVGVKTNELIKISTERAH